MLPLSAETISRSCNFYDGEFSQPIKPLACFLLDNSSQPSNHHIGGLSALAWDNDEQLLYALSDRGILHHLKVHFTSKRQGEIGHNGSAISHIERLRSVSLKTPNGKPYQRKEWADSESLAIMRGSNHRHNDTQLVVAFERQHRMQVHAPDGRFLRSIPLPRALQSTTAFSAANDGIEALTIHPIFGLLMTPQNGSRSLPHRLFQQQGKTWPYQLNKVHKNRVTALETSQDGGLVSIERAYSNPLLPITIALRRHRVDQGRLDSRTVATLVSNQGWLLDNFEGLARHKGRHYFMVSDDNFSRLQQTILVYFELPE